jgi:hypothetical protein
VKTRKNKISLAGKKIPAAPQDLHCYWKKTPAAKIKKTGEEKRREKPNKNLS